MEIVISLFNFISFVPLVAISFVGLLFFYKIYILIRSKFKILVNCWFCNHNIRVPYNLRNSWDCPNCDQYNGFNDEGDYNREIQEQISSNTPAFRYTFAKSSSNISGNGLCETCNENQRIIVEKLAQFEPKNEKTFEKELEKFKSNLEQKYRLCVTCERRVCKILHEKKKMILGSKLATFILEKVKFLKSRSLLKQVKSSKRVNLKTLSSLCLLCLAIVNFGIVIKDWTDSNVKKPKADDFFSRAMYQLGIHMTIIGRVVIGYLQSIWKFEFLEKLYLYIKTLVILSFYTIGFRFETFKFNFTFLSTLSVPFGSILLAFINNILDGFKLGKSALLLTVWSIHAGLVNNSTEDFYRIDILKVVTSITVLVLSLPSLKSSTSKLLDSTTNSFHRIYSEDYFSDDTREASSILNSTIIQNTSKNVSPNSSSTSIKSFNRNDISPRFLSPNKNRTNTISPFHFNSPVTSKSFCFENNILPNNTKNIPLQSFMEPTMHLSNNVGQPMSTLSSASFITCEQSSQNGFDYTANKILHPNNIRPVVQNQYRKNLSIPDSNPGFSYSSNRSLCRQNMISPSRLNVQACSMQSSWVSGGYFNNKNKFVQGNYFLESTEPKDTLSRASSQSSGFESQGSSASLQNGEQIFSRENSYCPEDCLSQYELNFNKVNNGKILDNSLGQFPQYQNGSAFSNNYNHNNSFVRCAVSPALSYQSLDSNYFANQSVLNATAMRTVRNSSSPFDLNKMGADLPSIQRGSLLQKWKEQNIVL